MMNCRLLRLRATALLLTTAGAIVNSTAPAQQPDLTGTNVNFIRYQGPAIVSTRPLDKRHLQVEVDPRSEQRSLVIGVELPRSAVGGWAADVDAADAGGRPMSVRHVGIEWHKFTMAVPAERATYTIRVVEPPAAKPPIFPEQDREATDPATGIRATMAKWHGGRKAALSIRFDDSHPSHVSKAIPILREYGFRGTFMVCPGSREPNSRRRSDLEEHRAAWEAVAQSGDQEFANHTAHHRGATGDDDMEREVGDAAKAIWEFFPKKSQLLALNLGGGTTWETSKTLRYYLDKYHLFDASSGSLGMDDVYGNRPAAFREQLQRHLERGLWCRVHYHAIGEKLNSSEANFRAALDVAKQHASDLWIAGMADVHKYQAERQSARLSIDVQPVRRVVVSLSCFTDPRLYDQPLTIVLGLPADWRTERVSVKRVAPDEVPVTTTPTAGGRAIRFEAVPITARYLVETNGD